MSRDQSDLSEDGSPIASSVSSEETNDRNHVPETEMTVESANERHDNPKYSREEDGESDDNEASVLVSDDDSSDFMTSDDDDDDGLPPQHKVKQFKKGKRSKIAQFIDDEAELSGDDAVSEDEADHSDDDQLDPELVDLEAKDLGSDEEEEVRRLYHKQLDSDDRRQLLLLQEHLEENDVTTGQRRRRKFRWQTKDLMENSLKRHYDPDDDDSQEGIDDEEDYVDYEVLEPRLRRPTNTLMLGSTKLTTTSSSRIVEPFIDDSAPDSNFEIPKTYSKKRTCDNDGLPSLLSDDSNSNTINSHLKAQSSRLIAQASSDMNRYLYRDKEIVEALSTKEKVIVSREEKDRVIQRELKRVLESKSVFDQLYG